MSSRYSRGKIYQIVSESTEDIYIGSTTEPLLSRRLASHMVSYKCWVEGKSNYVSSFDILKYGDHQILLLEEYPCRSKDALHAREQQWIDQNRDICVNKFRAHSGATPGPLYKAEYAMGYRERNHDRLTAKYVLVCRCHSQFTVCIHTRRF